MPLNLTVGLVAAFAALAVFAGWRGARPPDLSRGPRLTPWRFIMLLSVTAAVPCVVHLLNLLGLRTGGG